MRVYSDRLLRMVRPAVISLALACCARFLAQGASDLVALHLRSLARAPEAATHLRPSPEQVAILGDVPDPRAILTRNIFDYRTGSLPRPPQQDVPPQEPPPPPPDPNAPCKVDLRLAAAVFDAHHPERSVAILRGPLPGSARAYRPGMHIDEQHVLAEVYPRSARFEVADDAGSHGCFLRMFTEYARDKVGIEQANARATHPPKRRGRKHHKRRPAKLVEHYPPARVLSSAELRSAITPRGEGSYVVDSDQMRRVAAHWDRVEQTTRAVAWRHGRRRGLRLLALRRAGLLDSLGLRKGDVLRAVNGHAIRSPDDLQEAITRLGEGERVTLALERRGHRLAIDYDAH